MISMRNLVLVTGGAGYIGQHIVVKVLNQGYQCLVIDDLSTSGHFNRQLLLDQSINKTGQLLFEELDIRDYQGLQCVFKTYGETILLIIHLAARKSIPESIIHPELYQEVNVGGTKNLTKLALEYQVPKFVFSSTAAVYAGPPPKQGYREIDALDTGELGHEYAKTKRQCEYHLEKISQNYPMTIVTLRYFNPIGNIASGLLGEKITNGDSTGLMYQLGKTYLGFNTIFSIYGEDYPETVDGTAMRDFIDVEDLAMSHIEIINKLDKLESSRYYCFNVGTGQPTSVKQLVGHFQESSPKEIKVIYRDRRPGDQPISYANTSLLTNMIGWNSQTTLKQSCQSFSKRCQRLDNLLKR